MKTLKTLLPLDKVIKQKLISALFDDFQISKGLRSLTVLLCKLGGIGIINSTEMTNKENVNQRELTKKLRNFIIQQGQDYTVSEDQIKKNKIKNTEETNEEITKNSQFIVWQNALHGN